jgi:hypothetical protein
MKEREKGPNEIRKLEKARNINENKQNSKGRKEDKRNLAKDRKERTKHKMEER